MSSPPLARAAAKILADEPIELAAPTAEQRQRAIGAIREQLARNAHERARKRWIMAAGVAAAVVLAAGSAFLVARKTTNVALNTPTPSQPAIVAEEVHGAVFIATENGRVPLTSSTSLANGQDVVTDDGDATIALHAGSRVRIDPKSSAAVSEDRGTQLVHVKLGAVTAMVAKLLPTERFLVRTDEAEVEAHGTVFKVARLVQVECGARTSVHVVEGRISIRDPSGERFLGQSEDWMSPCIARTPSLVPSDRVAPSASAIPPTPPAPTSPQPVPSLPERPMTTTLPEPPPPAPTAQPSVVPYPEFGRRK